MNKVIILGTMTRDCEIRYTSSGTAIGSFGIAYNEKIKDASGNYVDKAHFFDVTAWGKTAENINKFFTKGSKILIDGQLDYSMWEKDGKKNTKVGIKVNSFDFVGDKKTNPQNNTQMPKHNAPVQTSPQPMPDIDIDDQSIPF